MKFKQSLMCLGLGLLPLLASAGEGHDIGNGGGAWVCRTRAGAIQWIQLVDAFEALEHRLVPEAYTGTEREILDRVMTKLFRADRAMFDAISPEVERLNVLADAPPAVTHTAASLVAIDDSRFWLRPPASRCRGGRMANEPEQVVNYRDDGTVWVQSDLFQALSAVERAALVLHEAVYAYRRSSSSDANSVTSRRIVGLMFSNLPSTRLRLQLESLGYGGTMRFVSIQPGTFWMGSPSTESGRYPWEDLHQVTLTHGFEMQTTEVTQAQWVAVMGANPSMMQSPSHCANYGRRRGVSLCPDHPVEHVRYQDVEDFIQRLNTRPDQQYVYRLPTEAEWEYAARAGTQTVYSFGDDESQLGDYAVFNHAAVNMTAPVQTRRPNPWGLYDMHGNVWEMVSDWWLENLSTRPSVDPVTSATVFRVIRGGSSGCEARMVRSAIRDRVGSIGRFFDLGFRLVRTRR